MMKSLATILFCFLLFFLFVETPSAQELTPDAHTLLLLHFNGNTTGADGETPANSAHLSYRPGIHSQGIYLGKNNLLEYAGTDNLDEQTGTFECWIKPDWNGDDGITHPLLAYGFEGGLHFSKDGGNWFSAIFNRFGWNPGGEMVVSAYVGENWAAGAWHHVAVTWEAEALKLYFDGVLVGHQPLTQPLPSISDDLFRIGSNSGDEFAEVVMDELRISSVARSAAEIFASFLAGQTLLDLVIEPGYANLRPTWRKFPRVTVFTDMGIFEAPPEVLTWTSSHPVVAEVGSDGVINALAAGATTVTGAIGGLSDMIAVTVTDPVLPPEFETIDPYLATSMTGTVVEIPVVILRFLPTADGVNLDVTKAPDFWDLNPISLADLIANIDAYDQRVKFSLEEGTRFRGYSNSGALPYLGYRVVAYITIYETTPPGKIRTVINGYPVFIPDFHAIFARFDLEHYINDLGVREVWIWDMENNASFPSYDPAIIDPEDFRGGWESNMSSPTTGDISNSDRDDGDLPVYNHTYIVYEQNFRRSQAEAVHNRGHQFEAMFSHVNVLQDGNTDLFWKDFVGQNEQGQFITGRCGWTHMPPNTTADYDYWNTTLAASDIEDWTPDGTGLTTLVNVNTWANLSYNWPGAPDFSQKTESQWYLYWMQSFPGFNNQIPYGIHYEMTNWWALIGDWDQAINSGMGLYRSLPLPVTWLWFRATPGGSEVLLDWAIASGSNNQGFYIERSTDGKNWESLAFLPTPRETIRKASYHFRDKRPAPGLNYYRLRQTDLDGCFSYSEIRSVWIREKDEDFIRVFPNPSSGEVFVGLPGGEVRLCLINARGQVVVEKNVSASTGYTQQLDLQALPSGFYFIQCWYQGKQQTVKFLLRD